HDARAERATRRLFFTSGPEIVERGHNVGLRPTFRRIPLLSAAISCFVTIQFYLPNSYELRCLTPNAKKSDFSIRPFQHPCRNCVHSLLTRRITGMAQ